MASGQITRESILRVALSLLDDGGLPALGMRRIAAELGVQPSALYWHFTNKQTLLAGVADEIVARIAPPHGDAWRVRLVNYALGVRSELVKHKDGADVISTAIAFELGGDVLMRSITNELLASRFNAEDAEVATSVYCHFVLGYVFNEQQQNEALRLGAIERRREPGDRLTHQFSTDGFLRGIEVVLAGVGCLGTSPDATNTSWPNNKVS
jgi:TetR/AcrR family tetracycline transcriptional repressor